ncbi:MAG: hypothetical protein ACREML_09480, partial [Vulcanimicrobiaceae bacterium]
PIVAMLHSSLGRRPTDALRALRERFLADDEIRKIWLTLPIPGVSGASYAIVVQVPDEVTRRKLEM